MKTLPTPVTRTFGALLAATAMLLSACGDSGGIDTPVGDPGNGVPVASVDEFSAWMADRKSDDAAEPFGIDGLQPPMSETAEPLVQNQ